MVKSVCVRGWVVTLSGYSIPIGRWALGFRSMVWPKGEGSPGGMVEVRIGRWLISVLLVGPTE
jgi:hypothetical protein